jgi:glycosyltransferase involved in cell wall biosynthesis
MPTDSQYIKLGKKHFRAVNKKIQQEDINFDIVHSHFTWTSGYVGAKLKEKYDVPFVVTAHGYDIYKLPFKGYEWKSRIEFVLNSADHIITVSNSNLECIKKLDVFTPVTILPNGFDSNKFYPRDQNECRNQLNLPQDKSIILTVGNLEEVKGQKYLIEAMREIIKFREDVLCYIVGSGPLENKLKKQISLAGLENYVKLVGAKSHSLIPIWINACDIFVLPSLNEGNPTVLVECLGCGKPFVGTNVGGIPEIVNSGDYGILCNPKNSKELTKNIFIALNREWNFVEIEKYANQFSWKQISSRIDNLYFSILKN